MLIEHTIILDVTANDCKQIACGVMAGEAQIRQITVMLTDGINSATLPQGTHAELYMRRSDGVEIHSACEIDEERGKVFHTLTESETAVPGRVECELRLQLPADYNGNIPVMYSPCFDLIVAEGIYRTNPEAEGENNSEWTNLLERVRSLEQSERPECIYFNWYAEPTAQQLSQETAKLKRAINICNKSDTSRLSAYVVCNGIICPASVSVFDEVSCYIYFSDSSSEKFFEIRYVEGEEQPIQYIEHKWGSDTLIETSERLPTSKAVASWAASKFNQSPGAYDSAKLGGYTDTEENFYLDLAAMQGLADELSNI